MLTCFRTAGYYYAHAVFLTELLADVDFAGEALDLPGLLQQASQGNHSHQQASTTHLSMILRLWLRHLHIGTTGTPKA
ncbi:hypothetical protein [Paenibacillus sp. IHB B 3084]|uniref:hypothetical protein n=1 Tax=Paenibacillus sp. IHB B 3084 TaxID=867076 RepID=UPI001CB8D628|nr:hypothetical protein [Paenibacillus sp. IHB B 3084]